MGEVYAPIQRGGGLPVVGGGGSLMTHSVSSVSTRLIFITGHGRFAIHGDLLFLEHLSVEVKCC
jgi:hypothetical protein